MTRTADNILESKMIDGSHRNQIPKDKLSI